MKKLFVVLLVVLLVFAVFSSVAAVGGTQTVLFESVEQGKVFQQAADYLSTCDCEAAGAYLDTRLDNYRLFLTVRD